MVDFATIQVHRDTKERIASLRHPGESYDAVLRRMVDEALRKEEDGFLRELNHDLQHGEFVPWD